MGSARVSQRPSRMQRLVPCPSRLAVRARPKITRRVFLKDFPFAVIYRPDAVSPEMAHRLSWLFHYHVRADFVGLHAWAVGKVDVQCVGLAMTASI